MRDDLSMMKIIMSCCPVPYNLLLITHQDIT